MFGGFTFTGFPVPARLPPRPACLACQFRLPEGLPPTDLYPQKTSEKRKSYTLSSRNKHTILKVHERGQWNSVCRSLACVAPGCMIFTSSSLHLFISLFFLSFNRSMPNRPSVELPDLAIPPGIPLGSGTAQSVCVVSPTPRAWSTTPSSGSAPRRGE